MKIDIYSGFLGAGKTTLIKKMISEAYKGEKLVLIENEFGEIGIDGGFLQDAGINVTEMNSGCICCSLVGDFGKALTQVISEYAPDRIIIEPSGVGKLSDVVAAVNKVTNADVSLGFTVAVVDAGKVKVYMKNFGEFYNNQVEHASTIVLSRTDAIPQTKLDAAVALLREHNPSAALVTTPWDQLTGDQLRQAMEGTETLADALDELEQEHHCCHGHHHEEEHEHHCCHGHHHEEEHEHHCCHGHHHEEEHDHHCCHGHHHEEEQEHHCCHGHHHEEEHEHHCCHGHHHEEEHEHNCCNGHHHDEHEHHHHHHADEVFTSWGVETARKFTPESISHALAELDSEKYGIVLRAKGIVAAEDGSWIHFDHVPGEADVRTGCAAVIGRLCVIGASLDEAAIAALFGV
ncbi:MAG: cobalamin biosynthesis protein CobW [Ruminococcaceae bacterium]|nr:cobalamin biosynthesis protein CobW [Oscillospiraceae bacterium]